MRKTNEGKMSEIHPIIKATVKALNRVSLDPECPWCGNEKFKTIGHFAIVPVSEEINSLWDTKGFIPLIMIQCENCGITNFVDKNLALNADRVEKVDEAKNE